MRVSPRDALTGWAALRWSGATWLDGLDTWGNPRDVVIVSPGQKVRPQCGQAVCSERLRAEDVVEVDGVRVTLPVRSVLFEMRTSDSLREAVVVADMALEAGLLTLEELAAGCEGAAGWRGVDRARAALDLVVDDSWSPRESVMRLIWQLDAGLPRPLRNVPVFDLEGRHVATPDLLDPVVGLVGEYDGAHHLDARRRGRDVRREAAIRGVGLEVVTMVAADSARHAAVARRIRAAHDRASSRRTWVHRWTLEPPPWWRERRG